MKNFLKFLLVFIGIILFYIYNNPDVVDKYRNASSAAEKDSVGSVENVGADTLSQSAIVTDSASSKSSNVDSVNVESTKDTIVFDTIKPRVNIDTFVFSPDAAKAKFGKVDDVVKKALTPYFKIEKHGNVEWYYARTAPICYNGGYVRCDHKAFYLMFGICETKIRSDLQLVVNLSKFKDPFVINKIYVVVDDQKFDISTKIVKNDKNMCGVFFVNYYIDLDNNEYKSLAWALYNAKSAKVLYVDNGEPGEMTVTREELDYIRHGINMFIACGQSRTSQL